MNALAGKFFGGGSTDVILVTGVATLERTLDRSARIQLEPIQAGNVPATFADIEASRDELGSSRTRQSLKAYRGSWPGIASITASSAVTSMRPCAVPS